MTPAERQHEGLLDALAFAFVSVVVRQLGVRPTPAAIQEFRERTAAVLAREAEKEEGPFGSSKEPTEPRTAARAKPR